MLIVCPACASQYEIDADRLGATGRSVRCASCRETWFITAEPVAAAGDLAEDGLDGTLSDTMTSAAERDEAADASQTTPTSADSESDGPGIVDQPMPHPRRRKPSPKKPARSRAGRALPPALAASLVACAILPLALLGRTSVVQAMPQTAGLFASIGLPVNLRGVAIRDVVAFQTSADGDKPGELVVEGDLIGVARDRVDVPEITIEVRDAHDHRVQSWTVPAPRAALENAETARFKASLSAPPAQGRSVQVRFAQAKAEPAEHGAAPRAEAPAPETGAQNAPAHGH